MIKNSTLRLWNHLLEESFSSDEELHKHLSYSKQGPKKETIDIILAYAKSIKGINTKSNKRILVSLN